MSQARWFIIHVYSGFEKKVKESIKEQAEQKGLAHLFEEILVPMEEVVEVRRGKKVAAERKFFPGYVMVRMSLNDETWSLVRNTAKVTGFLGPGGKPSPIPDHEADRIRNQIAGGRRAPQAHRSPSSRATMSASATARSPRSAAWSRRSTRRKGRLKVSVSIFGRATPVELEYSQVEKL